MDLDNRQGADHEWFLNSAISTLACLGCDVGYTCDASCT
jgi:hypothetical protein